MNNKTRENITGYLFILPYTILFLLFIVYTLIDGVTKSFYEITFLKTEFVGIENYKILFNDSLFLLALQNTAIFVVIIVVANFVFGIWIASTVFDKKPRFISFIQMGFYIPTIVSMVVMSIVWFFLLNPKGIIPYYLEQIGIHDVNFLGDPNLALFTVIFVVMIGNIGTTVILYIAAMSGISNEVLEAADIDGTSRLQKIYYIITPMIRPTTIYITVTNIVAVLRIFVVIQLLTGGGPAFRTVTLMYYLYLNAFKYNKMGIACAIGVIMFIIAFAMSIPQLLKSIKEN